MPFNPMVSNVNLHPYTLVVAEPSSELFDSRLRPLTKGRAWVPERPFVVGWFQPHGGL